MSETTSFDLVVLGAGPAGSAAAKRARTLGLSVLMIDKAIFPRPKLCGAGITPRSQKALVDIFGANVPNAYHIASRKMGFRWDGEDLAAFEGPYDFIYTYRTDFDHWLLREAEAAGAEVRQGTRVETILDQDDTLVLADGTRVTYKVLVGADGVASPLAKHLFGKAFDTDTIGFAYETEVPAPCSDQAEMTIDFGVVRWGYGWNFPKSRSRTIGVVSIRGVDQDLRAAMDGYLRNEGFDPSSVTIKGAHIPFGDYRETPGRGNVLLVGDAAGFVDAITGEGIALALESGAHAAEAAAQVIAEGRPQRADRAYYPKVKHIQADLEKVKKMRAIAYGSATRGMFKEKLRTSTRLREALFEVVSGQSSYADIEKRMAKHAMVKMVSKLGSWPQALSRKVRG
ncbi:geranylgeranyl reductase family protein [Maritimibacter sp. DP1N21-5]|uniref:geranylgeranyl reductase family protein n=1 Tax=Maritimibacter sp. DP1N21-5 TaxID=2836867 RepID=UPI001C4462FA|nr:geranylgeranyl reductase family protein [Maritimibacter sp. DP1N21-5]MBV7408682.1 geranylgeranyl reductase family protein [Maritimibacter sp. DP1N21-5]